MYPNLLGFKKILACSRHCLVAGKSFFYIEESQQIAGGSYHATLEMMRHLVKAGWIVRLGPEKYAEVSLVAREDAIPEANRLVIAAK
jgi:hypothetical protein